MKYFISLLLLCIALPVIAKHIYSENQYQAYWCNNHGGILNYPIDENTKVACMTSDYAIAIDFAPKWAENLGQALYYANKTEKKAACLLIIENPQKDLKYLKRLRYDVYKKHLNVKIFTVTKENIKKEFNS